MGASGVIGGPLSSESSIWGLGYYVPSGPVSSYSIFPNVSINFTPGGPKGYADSGAYQETFADNGTTASFTDDRLQFDAFINGTTAALFLLNPAANSMSLSVGLDDSGSIILSTDVFAGGVDQRTNLIDFEFQNGLVTVSTNSLGLLLPGVGSSANFALTSVSPFQANLPAIDPSNFKNIMTNEVESQFATLTTPEPGAFFLTLGALSVLAVRLSRR